MSAIVTDVTVLLILGTIHATSAGLTTHIHVLELVDHVSWVAAHWVETEMRCHWSTLPRSATQSESQQCHDRVTTEKTTFEMHSGSAVR